MKSDNNKGKHYQEYVKPVSQKDRVSQDIIGWKGNSSPDDGGKFSSGKKKHGAHPATQTNGDFIKWSWSSWVLIKISFKICLKNISFAI